MLEAEEENRRRVEAQLLEIRERLETERELGAENVRVAERARVELEKQRIK